MITKYEYLHTHLWFLTRSSSLKHQKAYQSIWDIYFSSTRIIPQMMLSAFLNPNKGGEWLYSLSLSIRVLRPNIRSSIQDLPPMNPHFFIYYVREDFVGEVQVCDATIAVPVYLISFLIKRDDEAYIPRGVWGGGSCPSRFTGYHYLFLTLASMPSPPAVPGLGTQGKKIMHQSSTSLQNLSWYAITS